MHYFLYVWHKKAIQFILYPFFLFNNVVMKKFYEKHGYKDFQKINDETKVISSGSSAFVNIGVLFVIIECALFNLLQLLIGKPLIKDILSNSVYSIIIIVALFIIAGIVNHIFIFRHNRYLDYFNEFEKMPLSSKRKYGWICFGSISLIVVTFVVSFLSLSN